MAHKCFENRELSWLKFNARVLEEAEKTEVPLLEQLKFAAIFQSNLDEFCRVRIGALYRKEAEAPKKKDANGGMTPAQQRKACFAAIRTLEPQRDAAYHTTMQKLGAWGLAQVRYETATAEERVFLDTYFKEEIRPLILPIVVDKAHPFPFLKNDTIYAALHLEAKTGIKLGLIPVTEQFRRRIPLSKDGRRFVLAEDLILSLAPAVFKNFKVIDRTLLRVTRSAAINYEDAQFETTTDPRMRMSELIIRRRKLPIMRLQLSESFNKTALDYLTKHLHIRENQIFLAKAPLDLSFVYGLADCLPDPVLSYDKRVPQKSPAVSDTRPMLAQIRKQDILLSYPYESIRPFLRLLQEAAEDPTVLSIQITLYRVARNSQVVEALCAAAENGIRVVVLVELRARFDEESNVGLAARLQEAGCTVLYGPEGFKVHSKLLLITQKSAGGVHYTTQIGTGNYNEKTACVYTDLSLMTANQRIGAEAERVFAALCAGQFVEQDEQLLVAPLLLRKRVLELMDAEIARAEVGEPAYIGLKLNSLSDPVVMEKLVAASCAGVQVDLVVRGVCCLIGGVPGLTEHITVRSIVGRFLEHSRIYLFGTPERVQIFIGSADLMPRNTVHRVEVAVPLLDAKIRQRVLEMFRLFLRDTQGARLQQPDGSYVSLPVGQAQISAQMTQYEAAYAAAKQSRQHTAEPTPEVPAKPAAKQSRQHTAEPTPEAPAKPAPKRPGRPKKAAEPEVPAKPAPKRPGRPKKAAEPEVPVKPAPKRPGRPKKAAESAQKPLLAPKRRGRPKKNET